MRPEPLARDIERELNNAATLAEGAKLGILASCLRRGAQVAYGDPDPAGMTLEQRLEQCVEFCGIAEAAGTEQARAAAPQIFQHIRAAQSFIA